MWKIDEPTIRTIEVVNACIAGLRDIALARSMTDACEQLELDALRYRERAVRGDLWLYNPTPITGVQDAQLVSLYEQRLVRGSRGRPIYDRILSGAPYGRCPYCFVGIATTLDHVLPKSVFPTLAVEPLNLVPCCADCNRNALAFVATQQADQLVHPYFIDDIGRWLFAEVVTSDEPHVVRFFAEPDVRVDTLLRTQIENTFEKLKLGRLYRLKSAVLLASLDDVDLFRGCRSPDDVKEQLLEFSSVRFSQTDTNHYAGVLYEALARSPHVCKLIASRIE